MSYTFRATLPALCLSLILPCALPVMAADPAPAKDSAPPAVERQPLIERSQEEAAALQRQLPQQEQQQLVAGTESFLALWNPANIDQPKGTVIIIPGTGESADWPQAVGPLRRKFPDDGWASLSLTLPDVINDGSLPRVEDKAAEPAKDAAPAKDPKAATAAKAPEPEKTAEAQAADDVARAAAAEEQDKAQAERIFARISSAIAYAQQQKTPGIVLLGHGSGAYWAARFLNEHPSPMIQKLVLLAAQEPSNAKPRLDELVPLLKVKTADFVYKDMPLNAQAAQQRLQVSKRAKAAGYTQVALTLIPGNDSAEQEQMFRRIRGWLEAK